MRFATTLASQPPCPGDGNGDGLVNRQDLTDYQTMQALSGGQSSWYDLNLDGLTDMADLLIIQQYMGSKCGK